MATAGRFSTRAGWRACAAPRLLRGAARPPLLAWRPLAAPARLPAGASLARRSAQPRPCAAAAPRARPEPERPSAISRALSTTARGGGGSGAYRAGRAAEHAAWEGLRAVLARLASGVRAYRWLLLANLACVLQLVQWAMDDVLWIRAMSCLANLCYFACNVNMAAWAYVPWDVAYVLLNLAMIRRTLTERSERKAHEARLLRTPELSAAYADFLAAALTRSEAHALLTQAAAAARALQPGEAVLVRAPAAGPATDAARGAEESPSSCVCLVLSGSLAVHVGGTPVGTLRPGDWVGHVPFLLEHGDATSAPAAAVAGSAGQRQLAHAATAGPREPAVPPGAGDADGAGCAGGGTTTLTALEPARLLQWPRASLAACLASEPHIARGVHVLWNVDLARRLAQPRALEPYEPARSTLAARQQYADVLRALVRRGALGAAQLDHLSAVRAELGVDEAEHARAVAQLGRDGSVPPGLLRALLATAAIGSAEVGAREACLVGLGVR